MPRMPALPPSPLVRFISPKQPRGALSASIVLQVQGLSTHSVHHGRCGDVSGWNLKVGWWAAWRLDGWGPRSFKFALVLATHGCCCTLRCCRDNLSPYHPTEL